MMTSPLLLVVFVVVCGVVYSQNAECITYPTTPHSSHNRWNRLVVYPRMHHDKVITDVRILRRNFYRCEMTKSGVQTMFYGTNGTHYWVERGCGGDFFITECNTAIASDESLPGSPRGFGGISSSNLLRRFDSILEYLRNQLKMISIL